MVQVQPAWMRSQQLWHVIDNDPWLCEQSLFHCEVAQPVSPADLVDRIVLNQRLSQHRCGNHRHHHIQGVFLDEGQQLLDIDSIFDQDAIG